MAEMLRQQLLDTSRGRIVTLFRAGRRTAEDVAKQLGLTSSAVRIHIAAMERDGVVRKVGKRPGTTRPSLLYELTPETEQLLSKAYVPLLTHLVDVFAAALPGEEVERLLRATGKALASELSPQQPLSGGLAARVAAASKVLNEYLGALTQIESNGTIVIRGAGCPLAAISGKHRGVCLAMESLVTELIGAPVRECCDRAERPRCCFEVEHRRDRGAP